MLNHVLFSMRRKIKVSDLIQLVLVNGWQLTPCFVNKLGWGSIWINPLGCGVKLSFAMYIIVQNLFIRYRMSTNHYASKSERK